MLYSTLIYDTLLYSGDWSWSRELEPGEKKGVESGDRIWIGVEQTKGYSGVQTPQ